jgi:hypothetical protein
MGRMIAGLVISTLLGMTSGSLAAETLPTDFRADYLSLERLEQNLADHGLEVLGKHHVAGSNAYTVVVYTSADLKKAAQLPERGFMGALRVLHNSINQEIVVSNPEYYMRAFLQKDYKEGMAAPVHTALVSALGTLTPTDDSLKTKKLAKYHFMMSMPYYDDFVCVGKGSTDELLKKLQTNAKDRIVFIQPLNAEGSAVLCGVGLPDDLEQFNVKLGTMGHSNLLPYMVLIENGEANILHAKFYLALSFPRLSMTEFMKIRAVPGDIEDAFKTDFE